MRRTTRASIMIAAIAAAASVAPGAASAAFPTWSPAGAAEASGTLRLTHSSGASVACDQTLTVSLVNDGTSNGGTVTGVVLAACTTNVPNCFLGYAVTSLPWQITKVTGDPTRLGIAMGVSLGFSGASCALSGVSVPIAGTVEGDYDGTAGELSFVAEPGLSSPLGPFVVDGELELRDEATGFPVDLT